MQKELRKKIYQMLNSKDEGLAELGLILAEKNIRKFSDYQKILSALTEYGMRIRVRTIVINGKGKLRRKFKQHVGGFTYVRCENNREDSRSP